MRVGARGQEPGVEARDELGRSAWPSGVEQPRAVREPADERARVGALRAQLGEPDGAVPLGQSLAVRTEQQGDVRVAGHRLEREQAIELELAAGRLLEVGAAHHARDALVGIVDDHGELVGDHAVAAAHDDVPAGAVQAHAERRGAAERSLLGALLLAQLSAAAAVERSVGAVRGRGRPSHVGPRAEALVEGASLPERLERCFVEGDPL